jgi:hypothetical protein
MISVMHASCTRQAAVEHETPPSLQAVPTAAACCTSHVFLCCHPQALAVYQELLRSEDPDPLYHIYSAACHYYMGSIQQAEEAVQQVGGHTCSQLRLSCSSSSRSMRSITAQFAQQSTATRPSHHGISSNTPSTAGVVCRS